MAHGPGPATSMSRDDVGPAGCSLVTVEARSSISTETIVTSPIRREKIRITIGETATWDQLMSAMRGYVESLPDLDRASVLILNWELTGSGSLHESLHDAESEQELFELLEADSSLADGLHMIHKLTLHDEAAVDGDEPNDEDSNPLLTGFLQRVDNEHSMVSSVMKRLSSTNNDASGPWLSRLETLAGRISHKAVASRCRTDGTGWFSSATTDSTEDSDED